MARWEEERRYRLAMMRWRIVILILKAVLLLLRIELVVILIVLAMAPISPTVLIPRSNDAPCLYLGARGLWVPGYTGDCPALAWRQHFFIRY